MRHRVQRTSMIGCAKKWGKSSGRYIVPATAAHGSAVEIHVLRHVLLFSLSVNLF